MKKSDKSIRKDNVFRDGKYWVRDPRYDIRQASGVTFGGRYVDVEEFRTLMNRRKKANEQQTR